MITYLFVAMLALLLAKLFLCANKDARGSICAAARGLRLAIFG